MCMLSKFENGGSGSIVPETTLHLRYLDRKTPPQSPDPIGDHNRPFAIGSTFSLKTNTFSFQKKLLASELWKLFMLPYFALSLPSIWQICRYSTLTTDILEKSVICNNFGFYHRFRGKLIIFRKSDAGVYFCNTFSHLRSAFSLIWRKNRFINLASMHVSFC